MKQSLVSHLKNRKDEHEKPSAQTLREFQEEMNISEGKALQLIHEWDRQGILRVGREPRQYISGVWHPMPVYWIEETKEEK